MKRAVDVQLEVRKFLSRAGKLGGRARAERLSPEQRAATARRAAVARWMRARFGVEKFEDLALPGWQVIDAGMRNLVDGEEDRVEALAVAEARPRLRYLGVPVPRSADLICDAREKLYRMMEAAHGELAHARFMAILSRVDSFCDALSSVRSARGQQVRRDRMWWR